MQLANNYLINIYLRRLHSQIVSEVYKYKVANTWQASEFWIIKQRFCRTSFSEAGKDLQSGQTVNKKDYGMNDQKI